MKICWATGLISVVWIAASLLDLTDAAPCSLIILDEDLVFPVTNSNNGMLTTIIPAVKDASKFVDAGCSCPANSTILLEVFISNTTYVLKRFEYTKLDDTQGFAFDLPDAPQRTLGWTTVTATVTGFVAANIAPWGNMDRLQLTRTGPAWVPPGVSIRIRRIELIKELPTCDGIPTPAPPFPIPECSIGDFVGKYWSTARPNGNADYARCESFPLSLYFDFSPVLNGIPKTSFSAEYSGSFDFPETAIYEFAAKADDGVRVILDEDTVVIDDYDRPQLQLIVKQLNVTVGTHTVRIQYYQNSGPASITADWKKARPTFVPYDYTHIPPATLPTPESAPCPHTMDGLLLWSSASTWMTLNQPIPTTGSVVNIPVGYKLRLDITPPVLRGIVVDGIFVIYPGDSSSLSLMTQYIRVSAKAEMHVGSPACPMYSALI
eukprot:Opistho-2@85789